MRCCSTEVLVISLLIAAAGSSASATAQQHQTLESLQTLLEHEADSLKAMAATLRAQELSGGTGAAIEQEEEMNGVKAAHAAEGLLQTAQQATGFLAPAGKGRSGQLAPFDNAADLDETEDSSSNALPPLDGLPSSRRRRRTQSEVKPHNMWNMASFSSSAPVESRNGLSPEEKRMQFLLSIR
eukprot:gb/GFBE01007957.1/.p1 GENE.gb/GFBE01007957.1/~~gb/GFBE01007957.1/.p1  ORF type:complete len:183 (+),score=36.84 gb/GFBE01007957.1/:1-549(+)